MSRDIAQNQGGNLASGDCRPIGVFDSGIGGLTVLDQIHRLLPNESTLYFGDTGRTPYGNKSQTTVKRYSSQIAKFLLSNDVKMIVIACNTASAYATETVKQIAPHIPVLEVVSPGARAAVDVASNGRIGVVGTAATVNSQVYVEAIKQFEPSATVVQQACPLFVGLAEEGLWHHEITSKVCEYYLTDLKLMQLDAVVLGCTHYPLLREAIAETLGSRVRLVDSAEYTAREVKNIMARLSLGAQNMQKPLRRYTCSDNPQTFINLASRFVTDKFEDVELIRIEKYDELF